MRVRRLLASRTRACSGWGVGETGLVHLLILLEKHEREECGTKKKSPDYVRVHITTVVFIRGKNDQHQTNFKLNTSTTANINRQPSDPPKATLAWRRRHATTA